MTKVSPEPQENEIDHIVSNIAYNLEDDKSSIGSDSKSEVDIKACSPKTDSPPNEPNTYQSETEALNNKDSGLG